MSIKRETNPTLMAHWLQEWKTLGRWQALNARLSRDATPISSGWARRSSSNFTWRASAASASVKA
jgi:hypothetical protein